MLYPYFQFLGKWYVIQKTKSSNKNQILHYSRGDSDDEYRVVEDAVRPIIGRTEYTGKLKPTDKPGLMTVKFQLSKLKTNPYDAKLITIVINNSNSINNN